MWCDKGGKKDEQVWQVKTEGGLVGQWWTMPNGNTQLPNDRQRLNGILNLGAAKNGPAAEYIEYFICFSRKSEEQKFPVWSWEKDNQATDSLSVLQPVGRIPLT